MMKRTPLVLTVLSVACALFLWSCKKDDPGNGNGGGGKVIEDVVPFTYTDNGLIPATAAAVYPALPVGQKVAAFSGAFESNTDSELAGAGYTKEQVIKIEGKELKVTITNNPGQNLDFMDSVWVYVSKTDNTEEHLFGYKYNYALGLRSLNLEMTGTDVKEVFRSDSVKMTFSGTKRAGSHTIMPNTDIEFATKVEATVNVVQ